MSHFHVVPSAFILVAFAISVLLYFLPTIIAFRRDHPNKMMPILLLNLFLGATVIVWVICLLWAFSRPQTVICNAAAPVSLSGRPRPGPDLPSR